MDIDDLVTRQPWDQAAGETSRNFHHFLHFLRLEPWRRSMRVAFTDHQVECLKKPPGKNLTCAQDWWDLRCRFSWRERAEAHDRDVAARSRLAALHAAEQMNARHVEISVAMQVLLAERLQQLAASGEVLTMSPLALAKTLALATGVERTARNVPTEIIKYEHAPSTDAPPLDLSGLDDQELDLLQRLMTKAAVGVRLLGGRTDDADRD